MDWMPVQIDINFADAIKPAPLETSFPAADQRHRGRPGCCRRINTWKSANVLKKVQIEVARLCIFISRSRWGPLSVEAHAQR